MAAINGVPDFSLILLLQSSLVHKETVYFYWTISRNAITNRLEKEQITNHFAMAGSFTTKVY